MKKKNYALRLGMVISLFAMNSSIHAQTYTFTNATATGNVGPTQGMVDTEYTGTTLDGNVDVTGGIQYWIVPSSGNYSIEAYGGQGYGSFGGRGAQMIGEFNLVAGDTLKILVGQQAGHYLNFPAATYNHQFGGGGGSFVTQTDNTPLVVAGGGGGNHGVSFLTSCDGQIITAGASGANGAITGAGGTGGNGGTQASSADGGGGLLGNGTGLAGGQAFVNGGLGGIDEGTGGFGCGGGTSSWNNYRGGGGGGYSGGGAANNSASCCPAGGGGGSFNSGANQTNLAGIQIGHGIIVINSLCTATTLTSDNPTLNDLTDQCSVVAPAIAPTATNDCGNTFSGIPDISFPISAQGITIVTWTYDDGINIITQIQNVIIADTIGPDPDVLSLPDSTYWCSVDSLITPTATDNCSGFVTVTNDAILPITTGGLTVVTWTYTDDVGNTSMQTQNITLDVLDNGISLTGSVLSSNMPGYSYQWLDCDNGNAIISGETNQSFAVLTTGNYAVEVTYNGCVDTSACLLVDFSGIDEFTNSNLVIYPNPSTDGMFSITTTSPIIQVSVIDALGRSIQLQTDSSSGLTDGSGLAAGKYIVRVITENNTFISKLVILK